MADLGDDLVGAVTEPAKQIVVAVGNLAKELLKFLFSKMAPNAQDKLAKEQAKDIKRERTEKKNYEAERRWRGAVLAKQLQESKDDITYAKFEVTKEQFKKFSLYAKHRGIPVASLKSENNKDMYLIMYKTKHSEIVEDITAQLIRDEKLSEIDNVINQTVNYKKMSFDRATENACKNPSFDKDIYFCERNNPNNYITASSIEEISDEGNPYINTEYKVFCNGKQQKCDEFKHGRFTHYTDKDGNSTSETGQRHWENVKAEMKHKGGFTDDIIVFNSKEEYDKYVEQFFNEREQVEKDSKFYDELNEVKEEIIREDIDTYNENQANAIFKELSEGKRVEGLSFDDTVNRFQCNGWEKEEPYYICKRTDPDNYMEVISEKAEFNGEEYSKHNYNIYVDDVKVSNPDRSDGMFTDERFEGRPVSYWKDTKAQMKQAGEFTDDLVAFYSKEEMLEYRKSYEIQKSAIKEVAPQYEADSNSYANDYSGVINNLKSQIKNYEDLGYYDGNKFVLGNDDPNETLNSLGKMVSNPRLAEAMVISDQITNYQSMTDVSNELAKARMQLQMIEKSELKNSNEIEMIKEPFVNKVTELEKKIDEHQKTEIELREKKEQIMGIKAVREVRDNDTDREEDIAKSPHGEERISLEQLKQRVEKSQSEKSTTSQQTKNNEHKKSSSERDR